MADLDDVSKRTATSEKISLGSGQSEGNVRLCMAVDPDWRGGRFANSPGFALNGGNGVAP